ncbi:MAG: hypothetical protein SPL89_09455 [Clostridia bacterium]|nr:hypothetical protein [Clostridia bacterium]
MEKFGVIRDRYIDLYRELYSKNSFDEMTDAERADMWDMIDEEIMADIVGFVRDGDTESLMDIFGYSIESVSDILDTVNAILDEGRKGAPTESDNAVNYQAESDNDVIELSHDNELSKRIEGLRGAAKYKAITDYILEALSEQPITMSDGTKVIVNKRDAQHISHDAATRKTDHISEIKSLVENAKLFAVDDNPDHTNYKLFKYYAANVRYDGQKYPVYLNVGESRNGSGYHLYDITKKIRETARRINGVGRVNYDLRPENGFSTNNIPQNSGNVNTNVRKNSENIAENSENGKNSTRFQAKDNAAITDRDIKAV